MTAHDLLTEPLISWRDAQRRRARTTLPGVLARLGAGELSDFPSAQAHQFEPWCMFLTQLAAIALQRSGVCEPVLSEAAWRSLLLDLTNGSPEPWCLVVEDLSKPAFFQAPVPEQTIQEWKHVDHPDDIDVLVTSKAHDVKPSRIAGTDAEAWAFALVTLQTTQGYPGRGYHGIARMKGGYGSRARVGNAPDLTPGSRFSRDVHVLLSSWKSLLDRGFSDAGVSLVWTLPWDGTVSLAVTELSPHFIEICQRLRLVVPAPAKLECRYTTSQTRRCLAFDKTGDVGDPWIPVERSDRGALTIGRRGFHYELLTRVLLDEAFTPAVAQDVRPDDRDPILFLASGMARGQGKTEGLHSRVLPIPAAVRPRLGRPDTRAALGNRARNNVDGADRMRRKVLFPALKQLALGEKMLPDNFDARVNEVFFDDLFSAVDLPEAEGQQRWQERLYKIAWSELQRAIDRCSLPSSRWYRRVSDAESMFWGCLNKQFPTLVESFHKSEEAAGETR